MQLLHQIVADVEGKAMEMEFKKSKGFAGGSCKDLFCDDQENCCVLAENKPCRHMNIVRPSIHVRFWYRCYLIDEIFRMGRTKGGKIRFN